MHVHILGVCGTFMGGIAQIARELGIAVSGSDQNVYPPMSTQLEKAGIELQTGFAPSHLKGVDQVVIGNALSRGNEAVEYLLNQKIPYQSGPEWLKEKVLQSRHVIAVAGTHGKTTTSSMVAWILEFAGHSPGFLIGGVPENFGISARLGQSSYFVIEADEYDTAFFDKRSKFVHYQPTTCILNNLEFDHADIFDNLAAIQKQFHHLVRTIPGEGTIIYPDNDQHLKDTLKMGCWSRQVQFGFNEQADWSYKLENPEGSKIAIYHQQKCVANVDWSLIGNHNAKNALAAIIAAHTIGIDPKVACEALGQFKSVKRRLEKRGEQNNITVYDDFAHHPTAISETLAGLRAKIGQDTPLVAVLDLRSNTMKMGIHEQTLPDALATADHIWVYQSNDIKWPIDKAFAKLGNKASVCRTTDNIIEEISRKVTPGSHICVMSNGGFENIHERILAAL